MTVAPPSRPATSAPLAPDTEAAQLAVQALLEKRRDLLAGAPASAATGGAHEEVLEFTLAGERYAIELAELQEILPLKEVTFLPGAPPFILGVINVRGKIIAVCDFLAFSGIPRLASSTPALVLILHDEAHAVGLAAEAVRGVCRLPRQDLQGARAAAPGLHHAHLHPTDGTRLALLNVRQFLADPRLLVDDSPAG